MKCVGIVGGGLGGLAAACVLAARGYRVTIFERNEWLGGKAAVLIENGFRFDMGPTILLMPSVLERIFGEAGRKLEDELDLVRLDPQWRSFFDRSLTPLDIDQRYSVLNGAIYGLASHGRFHGAFEPSNRSPDVRGLYLAGGAAHPGPGMPMVLMSGWIAADTLDKDARCVGGNRRFRSRTQGKIS